MKTPEEIKKGLECCQCDREGMLLCDECQYRTSGCVCYSKLHADAIAYIWQLEQQVPKWISVKERLPEKDPMLCLVFRPHDGDNEWDMEVLCYRKGNHHWENVTYWMPLIEPPEDKTK